MALIVNRIPLYLAPTKMGYIYTQTFLYSWPTFLRLILEKKYDFIYIYVKGRMWIE